MALTHNSKLDEKNEPKWSDVDKTKLPNLAFAHVGEIRSDNSYPHHWVKNPKYDKEGIINDGDMFLHKGGLNSAWAAANGARSGKKASKEVLDHLKEHRNAIAEKKKKESDELFRSMTANEWEKHQLAIELIRKDTLIKEMVTQLDSIKHIVSQSDEIGLEAMSPILDDVKTSLECFDMDNVDFINTLKDLATKGNESLMEITDDAWNTYYQSLNSSANLMKTKTSWLIDMKNIVLQDTGNIEDKEFNSIKLFGQTKVGLELTVQLLSTSLETIIDVWDNIRKGEDASDNIKKLILGMAKFGFTPVTIMRQDGGIQLAKLGYDIKKTGYDAPTRSSLQEKGYVKEDIELLVNALLNTTNAKWNLRKSQWWIEMITSPDADIKEVLRGNNDLITSADNGLLFLSAINVWLDAAIFATNQLGTILIEMDKVR